MKAYVVSIIGKVEKYIQLKYMFYFISFYKFQTKARMLSRVVLHHVKKINKALFSDL